MAEKAREFVYKGSEIYQGNLPEGAKEQHYNLAKIMFSDHAVKNSNDDLFGRKDFAFRIAEIVANRTDKDSIAIGIHAPWGEGKTSVLNMIVEGLEEHLQQDNKTLINGNIVLLKFNPWRFGDENQLLESFFAVLANKLEARIETYNGPQFSDN